MSPPPSSQQLGDHQHPVVATGSSNTLIATALLQSLVKTCTCSVCLRVFCDPTILPCGHVFCAACIHQWVDQERAACPLCNAKTAPRQLTVLAGFSRLCSAARHMTARYRRHNHRSLASDGADGSYSCTAETPRLPSIMKRSRGYGNGDRVAQRVRAEVREPTPELPRRPSGSTSPPSPPTAFPPFLPDGPAWGQHRPAEAPLTTSTTPPARLRFFPPHQQEEPWGGVCVLCGLDPLDLSGMKATLLRWLKAAPRSFHKDTIQYATASSFSRLLGPLWVVRSCYGAHPSSTAGSEVDYPAHQNCLVWAGWLPAETRYTDDEDVHVTIRALGEAPSVLGLESAAAVTEQSATTTSFSAAATSRLEKLWAAAVASANSSVASRKESSAHCCLCTSAASPPSPSPSPLLDTDAGLLPCSGGCGKLAHFPCAILAEASACVVYGLPSSSGSNDSDNSTPPRAAVEWCCGKCR